ncbi:MAG: hypothetical protein ACOVOJ_06340, partial [Pirellula sp.]
MKSLNPLRTFRLLTVAYAASWPVVAATLPALVPTGVMVAISTSSERVSAQQGLLPPLPPSTLPPSGSLPTLGQSSGNSGSTVAIPPASANPTSKEQALALTAQSKLALQKGDLVNAKRWIDQALSLKVADAEFASSAMKPREVAMEIDRAMRLRGIDPKTVMAQIAQQPSSPLSNASTSRVATAGAVSGQGTPVQSGLYQPTTDASSIAKASAKADATGQELGQAPDSQISGNQWYEKGLEALARDDREAAKECFTNAWKKKDELDAGARVQLKDKLAYLQSRSEPEAISAIPTQDRDAIQRKQRLFAEVSGEIAEAERMVNDKPYEAIDRLKNLRSRVSQSDVDGAYRKQMLAMVDRVTTNVESWMDTNRASIELDQRNKQIEDRISLDESMQAKEDAQIQTLVDQYNELMDDQRFAEAEVIARKVEEIKPNSEISALMRGRSVIERRVAEQKEIQAMKEEALVNSFTDAERASATYLTDSQPLQFPPVKEWYDLKKYRDKYSDDSLKLQPSERQILDLLEEPFSASFEERPLADAVKTISEMTGLIILIDEPSIAEEGLRSDQPISLDLRGNRIKLKNVLKNILEPLNLTYVVKNEVVKIQSRRFMQQEMYSKTYSVRDLVIPIANFISDNNTGMGGALQAAYQAQDSYVAVNMQEQDALALRNSKMASIDPNTN